VPFPKLPASRIASGQPPWAGWCPARTVPRQAPSVALVRETPRYSNDVEQRATDAFGLSGSVRSKMSATGRVPAGIFRSTAPGVSSLGSRRCGRDLLAPSAPEASVTPTPDAHEPGGRPGSRTFELHCICERSVAVTNLYERAPCPYRPTAARACAGLVVPVGRCALTRPRPRGPPRTLSRGQRSSQPLVPPDAASSRS
jgi:hypothetical protein